MNNMEVPFEREIIEEDENVEINLETRKRSHNIIISPTSSDISTITTCESIDTNFTAVKFVQNGGENDKFTTNGEQVVAFSDDFGEKDGIFEELINAENEFINSTKDQGTNGFSVHQNGAGVEDSSSSSSSESDEGEDKEVHATSNGVTFSNGLDTAVGLQCVESLLNESSSTINGTSDIHIAEQEIMNKILIIGQSELGSEATEYDVEGVISKQETHDLFCPNCNSCITKRVILTRRKRKAPEPSTEKEIIDSSSGQTPVATDMDLDKITEISPVHDIRQDDGTAAAATVDAVTCFSCLSIFIPTGKGILFWKVGSKPDVVKPDVTLESTPQNVPRQVEPTSPVVVEAPSGNTLVDVSEDEGTGKVFPMWILTCCQPYTNETKTGPQVNPDTPQAVSSEPEPPTKLDPDMTSLTKPIPDITPDIETLSQPKPKLSGTPNTDGNWTKPPLDIPLSTEEPLPVKTLADVPKDENAGTAFPLWIMTCCQPSGNDNKLESTGNRDMPLPPTNVPDKPLDDDTPAKPDAETPLLPDLKPDITANDENQVIVAMPEPPKSSKFFVIRQDDTPPPITEPEPEPVPDIEAPLLGPLQERPNRGVSALDIIKSIVYGGLLECITSLSIIASAAGGDATTLNVVALGLANVFGGLIVLFHSLRALKNEHTPQHYEEQLGKPGHFLLHATIAVISYLVFGLMAPLVYGFSFRKTDDKNLKLITLAAASLVCIVILSIAKSYVRRPPKDYIKTVFYYAIIGISVSGLGYFSGELTNDVLKKLGLFDSSSTLSMSVLKAGAVKAALSSY